MEWQIVASTALTELYPSKSKCHAVVSNPLHVLDKMTGYLVAFN